MHACLNVDEIVRLIARELVTREAYAAAVALGCCCKGFEDPVLDTLWEAQTQLLPLLMSLPGDVWNPGDECVTFRRFPTTSEWARFRKYARRMRELVERSPMRVLHLEVLPVLQLCAANGPLFPNLKSLDFWPGTGEPVPFIPLFLSAGLTSINMVLFGSDNYGVTVVSLIAALPALCPNLQRITLQSLPRDGTVTAAVSGMLLASSRNALQYIRVDSPLTVEAYEVICQLPSLRKLWVIVEGDVSLPSAVLPNLTKLMIQHDGGSGWSQMFRGATLEKLDSIKFHSGLKQPQEDFLETFERVALSISAQNTLSKFSHYKSRSWNPNYSCLLPFTQLTHLVIEHPCNDVCSSTVDDEVVTNLARAMPRLETLQLGDSPCSEIITGATVKGLVALAYHCLDLSTLRIHFKVDSFRALPVDAGMAPEHESTVRRRECALKELDIGYTFVSEESALVVALTLLRIFPHVQCTGWGGDGWDQVVDAINGSRQLVHYSSIRPTSGG